MRIKIPRFLKDKIWGKWYLVTPKMIWPRRINKLSLLNFSWKINFCPISQKRLIICKLLENLFDMWAKKTIGKLSNLKIQNCSKNRDRMLKIWSINFQKSPKLKKMTRSTRCVATFRGLSDPFLLKKCILKIKYYGGSTGVFLRTCARQPPRTSP